jgi:hypothetical protein
MHAQRMRRIAAADNLPKRFHFADESDGGNQQVE